MVVWLRQPGVAFDVIKISLLFIILQAESFQVIYLQAAAEEFQATREAVTLCDYSSFAKMDLWSSGREVFITFMFDLSTILDI